MWGAWIGARAAVEDAVDAVDDVVSSAVGDVVASACTKGPFAVGDVVRGSISGKVGKVAAVDWEGDIKVWFDGDTEATSGFRRAGEFTKGRFAVGDVVRGSVSRKAGRVQAVDSDGNIKVLYDGDAGASAFLVASQFTKGRFAVGDVVRRSASGKVGIVAAVDNDGDIKVLYDGDTEATSTFHYAREYTKGRFAVGDVVRGSVSTKVGKVTAVDSDGSIKVLYDGDTKASAFLVASGFTKGRFAVGDVVCGSVSRKVGKVTAVDSDGNIKVLYDGDTKASAFLVASGFTKGRFAVGDVVRGSVSRKVGKVEAVNSNGNIKVLYDGDTEASAFLVASQFMKGRFAVGDVVCGSVSRKVGKVTAVDSDGSIKVLYDGDTTASAFLVASGFTKRRFAVEAVTTAFFEGGESADDKRIKLTKTLLEWRKFLRAGEDFYFHYTSVPTAKKILKKGFRVSDSGMAGRGVYFSTLSPVHGNTKWPDSQWKMYKLREHYGDACSDTSRRALVDAVLIVVIPSKFTKAVPNRQNAVAVSDFDWCGHEEDFLMQGEIFRIIQLCSTDA